MRLDFCLDHEKDDKLIIEIEPACNEAGVVKLRLDSEKANFSFKISEKALRKLIVCGIRYFKEEPQGCFYHGRFNEGSCSTRKVFPAQKILAQYPL